MIWDNRRDDYIQDTLTCIQNESLAHCVRDKNNNSVVVGKKRAKKERLSVKREETAMKGEVGMEMEEQDLPLPNT
jgi:hypothetical protein